MLKQGQSRNYITKGIFEPLCRPFSFGSVLYFLAEDLGVGKFLRFWSAFLVLLAISVALKIFISTETMRLALVMSRTKVSFFSFKARPDPGVAGLGFPVVKKVLPAPTTLREEWTFDSCQSHLTFFMVLS